jgi:hypothetical protein
MITYQHSTKFPSCRVYRCDGLLDAILFKAAWPDAHILRRPSVSGGVKFFVLL